MSDERSRAFVFGDDAEQYDRSRPSYPDELIDDLVGSGADRVLDVGSGTGKVGRLFAARGCSVVGVDPDPRMAFVANRYGLETEISRFEDWDPAGRQFDLVVSGQAWHWVDPVDGPAKAAEVLAPGGGLALFWNQPAYEPQIRKLLEGVYRSHEPELAHDSAVLGTAGADRVDTDVSAIAASGRFRAPEVVFYTSRQVYSRAEYLDQLPTHSDHRLLAPERLARLLEAVGGAIGSHDAEVRVTYTTTVVRAGLL